MVPHAMKCDGVLSLLTRQQILKCDSNDHMHSLTPALNVYCATSLQSFFRSFVEPSQFPGGTIDAKSLSGLLSQTVTPSDHSALLLIDSSLIWCAVLGKHTGHGRLENGAFETRSPRGHRQSSGKAWMNLGLTKYRKEKAAAKPGLARDDR